MITDIFVIVVICTYEMRVWRKTVRVAAVTRKKTRVLGVSTERAKTGFKRQLKGVKRVVRAHSPSGFGSWVFGSKQIVLI